MQLARLDCFTVCSALVDNTETEEDVFDAISKNRVGGWEGGT